MEYIILSLKHGSAQKPVFWRANNQGYTDYPFAAGRYSEANVKKDPGYYNNGYSTIAVPLTDEALTAVGFTCSFNPAALESFHANHQIKSND